MQGFPSEDVGRERGWTASGKSKRKKVGRERERES